MGRCGVMRSIVAAAVIAATLFVVVIAAGRQAAAVRLNRLAITASEAQRGSYFAWQQARRWWPQLSDAERGQVRKACQEWRQRHSTLHWKSERWPPGSVEKSLFDGGLHWDRICSPAFYDVPLELVSIGG
jgi:hypothetical protein